MRQKKKKEKKKRAGSHYSHKTKELEIHETRDNSTESNCSPQQREEQTRHQLRYLMKSLASQPMHETLDQVLTRSY